MGTDISGISRISGSISSTVNTNVSKRKGKKERKNEKETGAYPIPNRVLLLLLPPKEARIQPKIPERAICIPRLTNSRAAAEQGTNYASLHRFFPLTFSVADSVWISQFDSGKREW